MSFGSGIVLSATAVFRITTVLLTLLSITGKNKMYRAGDTRIITSYNPLTAFSQIISRPVHIGRDKPVQGLLNMGKILGSRRNYLCADHISFSVKFVSTVTPACPESL